MQRRTLSDLAKDRRELGLSVLDLLTVDPSKEDGLIGEEELQELAKTKRKRPALFILGICLTLILTINWDGMPTGKVFIVLGILVSIMALAAIKLRKIC